MKELAPFVLQGLVMTVDEFYCHQRRTLNRWERVGHPADTFVFFLCFAFLWVSVPNETSAWIYAGLSMASCLMISKDEWQHRELCSGFENWLHSLLFILHPVVLIWTGYMWWVRHPSFPALLAITLGGTFFFFLYQTVYWNMWRRWTERERRRDDQQ